MAHETGPSAPPGPAEDAAPPVVNLQIVSPSAGVSSPLSFPKLDPATTVRGLKQKIRDVLPMKPADDHQRLIHRGRLLARDGETLQDVFGADMLRNSDQQTLHLVLRDTTDLQASSNPTPSRGRSPAPNPNAPNANPSPIPPGIPQPHAHGQAHQPFPTRFVRPAGIPAFQVPPGGMNPMAHAPPAMAQQLLAQQHQTMVQWMNQLQREAGYRQMLNQNQQARAAMGLHGMQDQGANPQQNLGNGIPGRNSPGVQPETHSFVREGVAPNGQHWRVLVNETIIGPNGPAQPGNPPVPHAVPGRGPLSPADVHNIMRNVDANQATLTMTNAMHRSASGASLHSLSGPMGGVLPRRSGSARPLSRTATPDQTRTPSHGSSTTANTAQGRPSQGAPEVYILSSPSGPRALLINNHSDVYYTPQARFPMVSMPTPFSLSPAGPSVLPPSAPAEPAQPSPAVAPPTPGVEHFNNIPNQDINAQPQQAQQGQQIPVRPFIPHAHMHPNNPGAGALLAAIWPHFWLLIRLGALVWWFTASDSSWTRWFTMITLALTIFIINTGLLDGAVNQAWEPLRQHLEGLIPFGDHNHGGQRAANVPAAPAAPAPGAPQPPPAAAAAHEPNPARAAARLVAQRREANADRLMNQVRRLERAGLLFLASIAPGVAERHIAHLENLEREAERRRREAEAAAEAAAAAEAEAAAAAPAERDEQEGEGEGEAEGEAVPTVEEAAVQEPPVPRVEEPLAAV